jgi:hypothetical protein
MHGVGRLVILRPDNTERQRSWVRSLTATTARRGRHDAGKSAVAGQPFLDDKLSFIQNVELTYMAAAGIAASPYVFNIEFD